MAYLFTNSTNSSNIATGLATQIIVEVNNQRVGAIQRLVPRQQRNIRGVAEVGTDGFIEKVPNQPTDVTLDVERIVFDRLRLPTAFARQFVNIHAQRVPFDIRVFDKSNTDADEQAVPGEVSGSENSIVSHVYRNCWFQNYSSTYNAGDYIISESATISCEFVRTFTGQDQPVDGGIRGITFDESGGVVESLADRGRRGSLDSAGLNQLLLTNDQVA